MAQPFDIDLAFELDLSAARASDDLADTISYADVHAAVVRIVARERCALLERLGELVLDALFAEPRIARARISIAKPRLLAGATPVVSLQRARLSPSMRAAIGIGSNVGDAVAHVRDGVTRLAELGRLVAVSSLYRSPAWGVTAQDPFVNAAALLETELPPRPLLAALKRIEAAAGRVATYRWGPRVLDLDILAYGEERVDQPDLVIPHPRLRERAFALVPLAQIEPGWAAARDALPPGERAAVVELEPR